MESDKLYSCIFDNGNELTCFELVDLLNEQQATISQLQDLCGKSDYENAKLRIENKKLKERNAHNFAKKMQLMKEIKELKAKLREKEEDEQLYANEILELREANKEFIQFKELGGDY